MREYILQYQEKPASLYDAQLRLTLPSEWVKQLNIISRDKCISRLAVIRLYLQRGMIADIQEINSRSENE